MWDGLCPSPSHFTIAATLVPCGLPSYRQVLNAYSHMTHKCICSVFAYVARVCVVNVHVKHVLKMHIHTLCTLCMDYFSLCSINVNVLFLWKVTNSLSSILRMACCLHTLPRAGRARPYWQYLATQCKSQRWWGGGEWRGGVGCVSMACCSIAEESPANTALDQDPADMIRVS